MVCAEGLASYVARLSAWRELYKPTTPIDVHVVPRAIDLLDGRDVSDLVRLAAQIEPQLIWLDTLARCHTADENSTVEMRRVMDVIVDIRRRTETTVIALHHPGLSNQRRGRGSSVVGADVDTVIEVHKRERATPGSCSAASNATPNGSAPSTTGSCPPLVPSWHRPLLWLSAPSTAPCWHRSPGQGMTAGQWGQVSGLKESTFYRRLRELVRAGAVRQQGKVYVQVASVW